MQKEFFIKNILIHKDKMYRFALSYLNEPEDAKDIVQDVLLKLWEMRQDFGKINNTEAWCMAITRNKSLDRVKGVGRKMRSDVSEYKERVDRMGPMQILNEKESKTMVLNAIKSLPPNLSEVVHLRDIQEYSYKEIAEILSMDMNQVKVNLFRGRQGLKMKLKEFYAYGC